MRIAGISSTSMLLNPQKLCSKCTRDKIYCSQSKIYCAKRIKKFLQKDMFCIVIYCFGIHACKPTAPKTISDMTNIKPNNYKNNTRKMFRNRTLPLYQTLLKAWLILKLDKSIYSENHTIEALIDRGNLS